VLNNGNLVPIREGNSCLYRTGAVGGGYILEF